jgi:hypothetical protein
MHPKWAALTREKDLSSEAWEDSWMEIDFNKEQEHLLSGKKCNQLLKSVGQISYVLAGFSTEYPANPHINFAGEAI